MDNFQQHDVLCIISFCSDSLRFEVGDLQYFGNGNGSGFQHSLAITYNKKTQFFIEHQFYNKPQDSKEDTVYIDNVIKRIYNVYPKYKPREQKPDTTEHTKNKSRNKPTIAKYQTGDLLKDEDFMIITEYFKSCLNEISETLGVSLEKMYFVLLTENHWAINSDIIDNVLKPLLKKATSRSIEDNDIKIMSHTRLEALLLNIQLSKEFKEVPPKFFQNENRCIMYDVYADEKKVKLQSIYFQLKEDYKTRFFDERYYIPKPATLSKSSNLNDIPDLKNALEKLLLADLLEINDLNTKSKPIDYYGEIENTSGLILDYVLERICRYLEDRKDFDIISETQFKEEHLKDYLDEKDVALTRSTDFLKTATSELLNLFSTQLDGAVKFLNEENDKVPFYEKSIVINGHIGRRNWLQEKLSRTFFLLFQRKLRGNSDSTWIFLTKSSDDSQIVNGIFSSMARKAMIANIGLPPVVIEKTSVLNSVDLPLHLQINKVKKDKVSPPEFIVYIDISLNLTTVICETVNRYGQKKSEFSVEFRDKRLSSIQLFLNSIDNNIDEGLNITGDNRSSSLRFVKSCITLYFESLIGSINMQLQQKVINLEDTRYVLSLEREITHILQLKSKNDIFEFIKKAGIVDLNDNQRKIMIADRGDKLVWNTLQKEPLKPSDYFVHSHVSDDYIYLKLLKVVNLPAEDGQEEKLATVFIKDKLVLHKNLYEQASDKLWCHIQSLTEEERRAFSSKMDTDIIDCTGGFEVFNQKFIKYLKEELLCSQYLQKYFNVYDATRTLKISSAQNITMSVRQLIRISIIPIFQELTSAIISCLLDFNTFGPYEISSLFVTGGCLRIKKYHNGYDRLINKELKKRFKGLLRVKSFRTQCNICIDTCTQGQPKLETSPLGQKPFSYDFFLKGELRTVSSSTYFVSNSIVTFKEYFKLEAPKHGNTYSLILRGDELYDRRFKLDYLGKTNSTRKYISVPFLALHKFIEPGTEQDMKNVEKFQEIDPTIYKLTNLDRLNCLTTLRVEVLHYSACIRISCEHHYDLYGKMRTEEESLLFGEKFSLKYF